MNTFHVIPYFWKFFSTNQRENFFSNLRNNWYFPVSAAAFIYLNMKQTFADYVGFFIAFILCIIYSSTVHHLFKVVINKNIFILTFSFISSIGICIESGEIFFRYWNNPEIINSLTKILPLTINPVKLLAIFLIIVSFLFVFIVTSVILNAILYAIMKSKLFADLSNLELIFYLLLFFGFVAYIFFTFHSSQAFYGTGGLYDVIYTSDSPVLVREKAYVFLSEAENDLRQPLFALFSAPFTGISYVIARILHSSISMSAFLVNIPQFFLMYFANIIIAFLLRLSKINRIIFVSFVSFTYTTLLFSVMMEQYIVAYFWLVFAIFEIIEFNKPTFISINGAIATLITSATILVTSKEKKENLLYFIKYLILSGVDFLLLLLALGRFEIIYSVKDKLIQLSSFSGKHMTFENKFAQFTYFVHDLFIGPNTATRITTENNWHLAPIGDYSIIGIGILVIVLISVLINYKDKISLIAGFWVFFSIVMLLILGWGTQENGLILYALYFGWAYFILIYRFVEKLAKTFRIPFIIPVIFGIAILLLLYKNVPAMIDMIKFAAQAYPV